MTKRLLIIGLIVCGYLLIPQVAQAHVLIRDDSKQFGAILHVSPDDDPIAGRQSSLFYDIQSQALANNGYTAKLQITDSAGRQTNVPVNVSGNSASSVYVFPAQGAYGLRLTITSAAGTNTFNYSQRVARGASVGTLNQPHYGWAEIALVASGAAFLLLIIVAFNRRRQIILYSKL